MTTTDDPLRPGALFQSRFRIERCLGRGGMGEVYAATDTNLQRPVAIKVIQPALADDPRYRERFLREARVVARLGHPNIVRVFDAGSTGDGRLYMILEHAGGESLRALLGRERLDLARALHYAIQIADGLAAAHEAALVHRDVKPDNVLIVDGIEARLFDFGVAKDGRAEGLTRAGVMVGTSRYMAPEQAKGSHDTRADIYSLGVVLYEMLAGAHPYPALDGDTSLGDTDILSAHLYLPARPLPEVISDCPEALWRAIEKCLEKDPAARFQKVDELAEVLRAVARVSLPPSHPLAQKILREAADAARAKAVSARGAVSKPPSALQSTAPLPPGFVPQGPGPASQGGAKSGGKLASAQMFATMPLPRAEASAAPAAASPIAMAATVARLPILPAATGAQAPAHATVVDRPATAKRLATTEPWDGAATLAAAGVAPVASAPAAAPERSARLSRTAIVLFAAALLAVLLATFFLLRGAG